MGSRSSTTVVCLLCGLLLVSAGGVQGLMVQEPFPAVYPLSGEILYVGGSGPGNYSRIQDAVDNASSGSLIIVYPGVYNETVVIATSLSLEGMNQTTTVIDGGNAGSVVSITASQVSVRGFTVQQACDDLNCAGIKITGVSHCTLQECCVQHNSWFGVRIIDSCDVCLRGLNIQDNEYGVYLTSCWDTRIVNCTLVENEVGIYGRQSENLSISGNQVHNRGIGLHLEKVNTSQVACNTITENFHGVFLFDAHTNTVTCNTVVQNHWHGVWLRESSENTITQNTLSENVDYGLFLSCSHRNYVAENLIQRNDDGIYIEYSQGNQVTQNHLYNWKLNAYVVAGTLRECVNRFMSNFWNRPRCTPVPILGMLKWPSVFVPFVLVDWRPLREAPCYALPSGWSGDPQIWYVGGSGPGNFTRIQEAVDAASAGDTIYVYPNMYYESVVVDKTLILRGHDINSTLLRGNGTRDILTITADEVVLTGFRIEDGHFAVLLLNASHVCVQDNIISNSLHGVSVRGGSQTLVSGNVFFENQYGLRLCETTQTTVEENVFESLKVDGFFLGTHWSHMVHRWRLNYWGQPRRLPKVITGKLHLAPLVIPWVNVDVYPSLDPRGTSAVGIDKDK